jgi:hypothetical protein
MARQPLSEKPALGFEGLEVKVKKEEAGSYIAQKGPKPNGERFKTGYGIYQQAQLAGSR